MRLAFLVRRDGWVAHYPSPAGPVEAPLSPAGARALAELIPASAGVEPEVEALLLQRAVAGDTRALVVPLDACYELVGIVRQKLARLRRRRRGARGHRRLLAPPRARRQEGKAMSFDRARAVADAVLFEGYALYPYRPTSTKNQLRWQFGVLAPRAASEATGCDPFWLESQCLVAGGAAARVEGKLRFLRLRRRRVEGPTARRIASLEVDGKLLLPWDEGELCELDFAHPLAAASATHPSASTATSPRSRSTTRAGSASPGCGARARRSALTLRITVEPAGGARLRRLVVRVENDSACAEARAPRDETLIAATLGTHLLLAVSDGEFVSLIDPPAEAAAAAARCKNVGTYPVLAGEPGRRDLLLSAPVILYDHPEVAPESPGDLFDATEIDEILIAAHAPAHRRGEAAGARHRPARGGDHRSRRPAAGGGVGAACTAPSAIRAGGRSLRIGEVSVAAGSRVRLRPGPRRSDAQDMFLEGRTATVQEVKRGIDGRDCLAVTVDDDPAAELHLWHGRYHYFYAR